MTGMEKSALGDNMAALPGKKVAAAWQRLMEALAKNPNLWITVVSDMQKKQLQITTELGHSGEPQKSPAKGDRRFTAEQWRDNPVFSFLMQNYLVSGEAMREVIEQADITAADKKMLRFVVGQYVDAASPTNFPLTNPEVLADAAQSGGQNFVQGMQNLMDDMQSGGISNTDKTAFKVGDNIACTPGKVIAQNEIMQLLEYAPQTPQVYARPLLIVPPCINRYYILDLQPGNSFIRQAVAAGHRVFLVSWVNAGERQQHYDWDYYLREGVMAAIDMVCAISGQDKINTLGFCIGGTMLASALAVLAQEGQKPAHSMTLLAAMLDFSDAGEIGMFVDEERVAEYETQFAGGGLMDGGELARGFAALRPNDLIWPYVINNYYRGRQPQAFDLLFWNADSCNLPGPMFAEYLRATYLENRIANKTAVSCGVPVDLSLLTMPVYGVACEKDHIVPWRAAFASAAMMGGKTRFVLSASGHIAGIINPPESGKGWYQTLPAATLSDSAQWQEAAATTKGSWWNDWLSWMSKNGGRKAAAPKKPGSVRYAPLEAAPGAFVCAQTPNSTL